MGDYAEPGRGQPRPKGRTALISILAACGLVGGVTLVRWLLNPALGTQSPFMLYVAAVVVAGFARGSFCGGLVMFGGGLAGLFLFLSPDGLPSEGALIALGVFWLVAGLVLMVANELRLGVKATFDRVQAMARRGRAARADAL